MKKLLGFIVFILTVLAAGYFYYLSQWQKQVDEVARQVSMLGGELDYREISLDAQGNVNLEGVFFKVPMQPMVVRMDRVAVHTGGIMGVYQLDLDIKNERLPETLGISFEGVRMTLSTLTDNASDSTFQQLTAAGCGERQVFSEADYRAMGYSEWVMDFNTRYRVQGSGAQLQFSAETHLHDMYSLEMTATVGLSAASRQLEDIAMAMAQAQFIEAMMEYRDRGFAARAVEYCREQTGLSREEYLAQHVRQWQAVWEQSGLTPGENLQRAYQQFLQAPDRLRLDIAPTPTFNPGILAQRPPLEWLGFLDIEVAVNDREAVPVSFRGELSQALTADKVEAESSQTAPTQAATSLPPPINRAPEPTRIPLSALGEHIDEPLTIVMHDGRELSGRIQSIERDSLQLQRSHSGGYFIQPVRRDDIAHAQIP